MKNLTFGWVKPQNPMNGHSFGHLDIPLDIPLALNYKSYRKNLNAATYQARLLVHQVFLVT